jgi:hypothetical protein
MEGPHLISKGKSYLSSNSLGKSYISFNRGEDFLEINQSETRIAKCTFCYDSLPSNSCF